MQVRVPEYRGVSQRTGKSVKGTLSISLRDHMLNCEHQVACENFRILWTESNKFILELKESLFTKRDKPFLS